MDSATPLPTLDVLCGYGVLWLRWIRAMIRAPRAVNTLLTAVLSSLGPRAVGDGTHCSLITLCFAEPRKVVVGMLRSASGSCYRTKKASFHAVGAPDCPALGHLAAVWWESASRVEQVSCQ